MTRDMRCAPKVSESLWAMQSQCTAHMAVRTWHTYLKDYYRVWGNFVGISSGSIRVLRFTQYGAHLTHLHGQHTDVPRLKDLSCEDEKAQILL